MNINLVKAFILVLIAQFISYFQLQGQFISPWIKNNPMIMSLVGLPISLILIKFTKYCADGFGGEVWPGRLIGFAVGAIVFALMSHFLMKEPFNLKTIVSLCLASAILLIQVFWK
jgi:hypothetical protein